MYCGLIVKQIDQRSFEGDQLYFFCPIFSVCYIMCYIHIHLCKSAQKLLSPKQSTAPEVPEIKKNLSIYLSIYLFTN